MRILFADSNHPILHELLIKAGYTCDLFWDKSAQELQEILPDYDALVIRSKFKLNADLMAKCKQLKCIGRVGAGLENIDVDYASSNGIKCLSVPEGNRDAVGEHALGMLLMLLNNLKKVDNEVRNGIWLRAENRGIEITGKTVGIIGYGNTGQSFAKKLSGFECKILAYDKYKNGFADNRITEARLEDIYSQADIVSLHVPLTKETTYMFDSVFFSAFAKPIYIINTSRGKCLKTEDLVAELKSGKLLGACLDVLEYESVSFEKVETSNIPEALDYLIHSEKVVLSPHIAGWTHESNFKMSKIMAQKMIDFLNG